MADHLVGAIFYAKHEQGDAAIAHMDKILKLNPSNGQLLAQKVWVLLELRQVKEALAYLNDAKLLASNTTYLREIEQQVVPTLRWSTIAPGTTGDDEIREG